MKTGTLRCCKFSLYVVTIEMHTVITRRRFFVFVREGREPAAARFGGITGFGFKAAGLGHQQKIAQVGMAGAAEMRVTETIDGTIVVLVTGAVFVYIGIVFAVDEHRQHAGLRTQLYHTERSRGPGIGMAHALCADKGVYKARKIDACHVLPVECGAEQYARKR